jgi:hypothetical protein
VHPWTVTLQWAGQSAVRRRWLSWCTLWPSHSQWPIEQISFITTMPLPILQLSCRLFWGGQSITSPSFVCPSPLQPRFGFTWLLAFPKVKVAVERENKWMRRSQSTQVQSTASHCRLTSPTIEWFHGCAVESPLTGCQVTSRPSDRFSRYSKWLDTLRTTLVLLQVYYQSLVCIPFFRWCCCMPDSSRISLFRHHRTNKNHRAAYYAVLHLSYYVFSFKSKCSS